MTTSPTSVARQYPAQLTHYLRKTITFADNGSTVEVGVIPAGAVVIKPTSGVHIVTAFNAGTTNTVDIGTTATGALFGSALALGTATFVPCAQATGAYRQDAATRITATINLSGTAATTGEAEILIFYVPDNDL